MAEPTSALTFEDLISLVARTAGTAYYGAAGGEAAQAPTDAFDLAEAKRFVNAAIRMAISNAPPSGWVWAKPLAELVLWPDVAVDPTVTATGVYTDVTTITASEATFYPSMEGKTIVVTDTGSYTVVSYTSSTVITIAGDNAFTDKTFSIAHEGAYTLPQTFGGQHDENLGYAAASCNGAHPRWVSESVIRALRADESTHTGTPELFAVRKMALARRWELVAHPDISSAETISFSYDLCFDSLTALTDLHPAGFAFDELIRAACLAKWESEGDDVVGGYNNTYRTIALPDAYNINARMKPKRLGYCGNPGSGGRSTAGFRRDQRRPTVTYTSGVYSK